MKRNVNGVVRNDLNREKLPASIQSAFDQTYEQIRQQSKKKKAKNGWIKPVSAAAAAIALSATVLFTNDAALAKLQAFLGMNDPGLNLAAEHGDVQNLALTQQSENITMTLDNLFVDAYRLGLQFTIESEHIVEDNLFDIEFEYRLFDAEGTEISALISDTKEIANTQVYTGMNFHLTDITQHSASVEMLADASVPNVPSLEGATLVVETIHFSKKEGGLTSVDGEWAFDLTSPNIVKQQYVAQGEVPGLAIKEAVVSNGSMYVTYTIDEINVDENIILETAVINEQGQTFYAQGGTFKKLEQQTEVSLVLPYSVWQEQQTLSLKVKDYEPLTLIKKE